MKKTIGGDRLGSGNKMNTDLHNYSRSSHNIGKRWRSTMSAGTLVPFYVNYGTIGTDFEIDINSLIRTQPTNTPLFGEFKVQVDFFSTPVRLYNSGLHGNMKNIGNHMDRVKLPQLTLTKNWNPNVVLNNKGTHPSSLLNYLGIKGIGHALGQVAINKPYARDFCALGVLNYWDIVGNYYANNQETNAYVIDNQNMSMITIISADLVTGSTKKSVINQKQFTISAGASTPVPSTLVIKGTNLTQQQNNITIFVNGSTTKLTDIINRSTEDPRGTLITGDGGVDTLTIYQYAEGTSTIGNESITGEGMDAWWKVTGGSWEEGNQVVLRAFPLTNIDQARKLILKKDYELTFNLNKDLGDLLPYNTNYTTSPDKSNISCEFNQAGLAIKTYQSDRFNNWLNQEWIEGQEGISKISAVQIEANSFTIDSLILSRKIYDMLNRIAVSGGTYHDWQEVIYGEEALRIPESPIYMGGMSSTIQFEEVVSTAASEGQVLGSLAGRGREMRQKGGHIEIKCKEISIIMGIVSITPIIDYSQGNKWFTRLETMDDFHKPGLDGIGFQDLLTDEMDWRSTQCTYTDASNYTVKYTSAGKQPAWIEYMTDQDETHGEFAAGQPLMLMSLNRQYQLTGTPDSGYKIKDLTTYIDPSKYNYCFAETGLGAQNFWVQIGMDITRRAKMSAKIIPNL